MSIEVKKKRVSAINSIESAIYILEMTMEVCTEEEVAKPRKAIAKPREANAELEEANLGG